jgi:hypothetical protein
VTAAERAVRDFFISYTGVNRPWAEWIAVELERHGLVCFDHELTRDDARDVRPSRRELPVPTGQRRDDPTHGAREPEHLDAIGVAVDLVELPHLSGL